MKLNNIYGMQDSPYIIQDTSPQDEKDICLKVNICHTFYYFKPIYFFFYSSTVFETWGIAYAWHVPNVMHRFLRN